MQGLRIVQQETVSARARSQPGTGPLDVVTNVPSSWPSACVCSRPIRHSLSASWSATAGLVPAAEYEWCPSLLRLPSGRMRPDQARLESGSLSLTPPGCARDFSPPPPAFWIASAAAWLLARSEFSMSTSGPRVVKEVADSEVGAGARPAEMSTDVRRTRAASRTVSSRDWKHLLTSNSGSPANARRAI